MTKIKIRQLTRFEDKRGILVFANPELLDFEYKYLTMGTMTPGSRRGGHYHKRIEEKLLVLQGEITFVLDEEKALLRPGDIIDIPTGAMHTLFNEGNETAVFVEFKSENFNHEDHDTYTE